MTQSKRTAPFWAGYIADTKNHEEIVKCVSNHDELVKILGDWIICTNGKRDTYLRDIRGRAIKLIEKIQEK